MLTDHAIRAGTDDSFDAVEAVRQLPEVDKVAIGYAAAQLACVIEANFPGLDRAGSRTWGLSSPTGCSWRSGTTEAQRTRQV